MNLYDMTAEYTAILRQIEEADGEITDEQVAALEALGHSIEIKAENVAKFIRSLECEGMAQKAESDRLAAKARVTGNKVDRLKGYLMDCMRAAGRDKIKGDVLSVGIQKTAEHPDVTDPKALPERFWRKPEAPPPEPDKKAIMDARKLGEDVPGVTFSRTEFIRIR